MKNFIVYVALLGALVGCSVAENSNSSRPDVEAVLKGALGYLYPSSKSSENALELNKVIDSGDLVDAPTLASTPSFKAGAFYGADALFYAANIIYSPEPTKDLTDENSYPYDFNVTTIALIDNTKIRSQYAPVQQYGAGSIASTVPAIENLLQSAKKATVNDYSSNNVGIYTIAGEDKKFMFRYLDQNIEFHMVKANNTDFLAASTDFSVIFIAERRGDYLFFIIRPNSDRVTLNAEKFGFSGSGK
ncbi:MAG: hypothetical protein ACRC9L_05210 [Brevinema sp.]